MHTFWNGRLVHLRLWQAFVDTKPYRFLLIRNMIFNIQTCSAPVQALPSQSKWFFLLCIQIVSLLELCIYRASVNHTKYSVLTKRILNLILSCFNHFKHNSQDRCSDHYHQSGYFSVRKEESLSTCFTQLPVFRNVAPGRTYILDQVAPSRSWSDSGSFMSIRYPFCDFYGPNKYSILCFFRHFYSFYTINLRLDSNCAKEVLL